MPVSVDTAVRRPSSPVASFSQETCEFVGRKLRRVRWQTPGSNLDVPDKIAAGSWDDDANEVVIWRLIRTAPTDSDASFGIEEAVKVAKCASYLLTGDSEDLKFFSDDNLLVSTSFGDVHYLAYSEPRGEIRQLRLWKRLHEGACTAVSLLDSDTFVSVGTEGWLLVTDLNRGETVHRIGDKPFQSVGSFYCMQTTSRHEVITGNSLGHIQTWDLRQPTESALVSTMDATKHFGVLTLCCHPGQPYLLASGTESGTVNLYDLRQDQSATSSLSAHKGMIWEVKFHPAYPANLFTASDDERLLHLDASGLQNKQFSAQMHNPWLISDLLGNMRITSLLPPGVMSVNSMDVIFDSLVCCTDNESLWILKGALIQ